MNITLKRWGNSAAIRLPKSLLSKIGDDIVSFNVETSGKNLLLKPVEKTDVKNLSELFEGFDTEAYQKENHGNLEHDLSEAYGREFLWIYCPYLPVSL